MFRQKRQLRRFMLVSLFFVLFTLVSTSPAYSAMTWTPLGNTGVTGSNWFYSLATDNGVLYAAYADSAGWNTLKMLKYQDGVWTSLGTVQYPMTGGNTVSVFVVNGVPYVAARHYTTAYQPYLFRYDGGTTWTQIAEGEVFTNYGTGYAGIHATGVAINPTKSVLYLAYSDGDNNNTAKVVKYEDGTWSSLGTGLTAGKVDEIVLKVNNGALYMATGESGRVKLQYYDAGTSTWIQVGADIGADNANNSSGLDLEFIGTTPYVGYRSSSFPYKVMRYTDGAWSTTGVTGSSSYNSMAIEGENIYMAGINSVYKYDQTSWTYQGSLHTTGTNYYTPYVIDATGHYVMFFEATGNKIVVSKGTETYPPGKPTDVSAAAENGQAVVSFTAPASNGGSAITSYMVKVYQGESEIVGLRRTGAASPITVPGLTNGTAYTFKVAAANSVGWGADSDPSAVITPATVPGAPTGVTAVAGNAQATVSFTAPWNNGGAAITGYTVKVYLDGVEQAGLLRTGAASPITVPGLTNGTKYTFGVIATNAQGNSEETSAEKSSLPTLAPVTISSNNVDTTKAKAENVITIQLTASENIMAPTVTIAGRAANITDCGDGDARTWQAQVTLLESDPDGEVPFNISFLDYAGNSGVSVTETTDESSVIMDGTAPVLNSVQIQNVGPDQIKLAFPEPVMLNDAAGFAVSIADSPVDITSFTVSGTELTLQLASPAAYGQAIQLSYTAAEGNLTDLSGNPLADITTYSVDNQVGLSDEEAVSEDKENLAIVTSPGQSIAAGVSSNITLPTQGANGSDISWSSGNTAVINIVGDTGVVTRPPVLTVVMLTATITKNGHTETKQFPVTVLAIPASDNDSSDNDTNRNNSSSNLSNEVKETLNELTKNNINVGILVDGQKQDDTAKVAVSYLDNQTVVAVKVDEAKALAKITEVNNTVTIPVSGKAEVIMGQLTGAMVKAIEQKAAVVEVATEKATYTIPAAQINIDAVAASIGQEVTLQDIDVYIKIAEPSKEVLQKTEEIINNNPYSLVIPPLEFQVYCTSQGKTVEVERFNAYVERAVIIPDGVDPNKISTGIVVEPNGSVRHVPTKIIIKDGKYYAQINSLSNSTYSVIWNPQEFGDVAVHWAKDEINDLGSRLIVSGVGQNEYKPDLAITRAEFAAILVRALGLKPNQKHNTFTDVKAADWYYESIETAVEYNLLSGYGQGKFGPLDKITREQAMAMLSNAMKITGLKANLQAGEVEKLLAAYVDSVQASEWAKASIANNLQAGIVTGKASNNIAPKDKITRAEVAVMVRRLLQKSDLI